MFSADGRPLPIGSRRGASGADRWLAPFRAARRALLEAPDIDGAIALVAFVVLLLAPGGDQTTSQVTVASVVLSGATALPLVVRRRYPLAVLTAVVIGLLACLAVFHPDIAAVAIVMLAVYTVGLQGDRGRSLLVGAAMAPIVACAVAITAENGFEVTATVARLALVLAALAVGDARRGRLALLHAEAEEADREREAATVHRLDEERLRIARELHDTVAHTLVAINVQAAAAVHRQRHHPGEELSALEQMKESSADALNELRATLKLLRPSDGEVPLHPPPSLDDLPELISGVAAAGVTVELDLDGVPDGLAASTAHAAYRIVQEGLTNVLRHSRSRVAAVHIAGTDGVLTIEITDPGPAIAPTGPPEVGHGLRGMAERATALGGHCRAGVDPGGGWRVAATLPREPTRR